MSDAANECDPDFHRAQIRLAREANYGAIDQAISRWRASAGQLNALADRLELPGKNAWGGQWTGEASQSAAAGFARVASTFRMHAQSMETIAVQAERARDALIAAGDVAQDLDHDSTGEKVKGFFGGGENKDEKATQAYYAMATALQDSTRLAGETCGVDTSGDRAVGVRAGGGEFGGAPSTAHSALRSYGAGPAESEPTSYRVRYGEDPVGRAMDRVAANQLGPEASGPYPAPVPGTVARDADNPTGGLMAGAGAGVAGVAATAALARMLTRSGRAGAGVVSTPGGPMGGAWPPPGYKAAGGSAGGGLGGVTGSGSGPGSGSASSGSAASGSAGSAAAAGARPGMVGGMGGGGGGGGSDAQSNIRRYGEGPTLGPGRRRGLQWHPAMAAGRRRDDPGWTEDDLMPPRAPIDNDELPGTGLPGM